MLQAVREARGIEEGCTLEIELSAARFALAEKERELVSYKTSDKFQLTNRMLEAAAAKQTELMDQLRVAEARAGEAQVIVSAAVELESYLARVNTQERQSIVFQVPDDDTDGVALAGFCERLTRLSKAIRAAPPASPTGREGKAT